MAHDGPGLQRLTMRLWSSELLRHNNFSLLTYLGFTFQKVWSHVSCHFFLSSLGCSRDSRHQVPWLQISWSYVAQSEGETLCKTCVLGFYYIKLAIGNKGSEIVKFQSSWLQNLCLIFFFTRSSSQCKVFWTRICIYRTTINIKISLAKPGDWPGN